VCLARGLLCVSLRENRCQCHQKQTVPLANDRFRQIRCQETRVLQRHQRAYVRVRRNPSLPNVGMTAHGFCICMAGPFHRRPDRPRVRPLGPPSASFTATPTQRVLGRFQSLSPRARPSGTRRSGANRFDCAICIDKATITHPVATNWPTTVDTNPSFVLGRRLNPGSQSRR
jgi:hypothetical protein